MKHMTFCGVINSDCSASLKNCNEIYLLIKYIKSVLWGVEKRLSFIEDAWCLKVNMNKKKHWPPLLILGNTMLKYTPIRTVIIIL
jgi:hypothetical protein